MSNLLHVNTVVHPLKMLKYLRLNGKCKIEELANVLGLEERTVRRYYYSLKELGYPIMSKAGKNGGYYLNEPNICQSDWEILRRTLKKHPELYNKIELRLLEEFSPRS